MNSKVSNVAVYWHAVAHGVASWPWYVWVFAAIGLIGIAIGRPARRRSARR